MSYDDLHSNEQHYEKIRCLAQAVSNIEECLGEFGQIDHTSLIVREYFDSLRVLSEEAQRSLDTLYQNAMINKR